MLVNSVNWREIAFHRIPRMLIDEHEPFRPIRVGVTVLTESGPSPSFKRMLMVDGERVGKGGWPFLVRESLGFYPALPQLMPGQHQGHNQQAYREAEQDFSTSHYFFRK